MDLLDSWDMLGAPQTVEFTDDHGQPQEQPLEDFLRWYLGHEERLPTPYRDVLRSITGRHDAYVRTYAAAARELLRHRKEG